MIDRQRYDDLIKVGQLTETDFENIRKASVNARLFIESGKVKEVLESKPTPRDVCIIDWINFTMHKDTFYWCNTDNDVVYYFDQHLRYMAGFGITEQRKNGAYLYDKSYTIGDNYGLFCIGGQRDTLLCSISGTGCQFLQPSFSQLLYLLLTESKNARITRIDLAHDDFDGDVYTLDNVMDLYNAGKFTNGFRKPNISQVGNWANSENLNGRTIYVGSRSSGLYFRAYEKGLQLKNPDLKNWVRCEIEFKSIDRIIPFEILLNPQDYFAGAYPAFENHSLKQSRIDTYKHEISSDLNHRITWARRQLGNLIYTMQQQGYTDTAIIDLLAKDDFPTKHKQKFIPNDLSKTPEGIRAHLQEIYPAHNFTSSEKES
jgi:phage replication initiation protein